MLVFQDQRFHLTLRIETFLLAEGQAAHNTLDTLSRFNLQFIYCDCGSQTQTYSLVFVRPSEEQKDKYIVCSGRLVKLKVKELTTS